MAIYNEHQRRVEVLGYDAHEADKTAWHYGYYRGYYGFCHSKDAGYYAIIGDEIYSKAWKAGSKDCFAKWTPEQAIMITWRYVSEHSFERIKTPLYDPNLPNTPVTDNILPSYSIKLVEFRRHERCYGDLKWYDITADGKIISFEWR